ncbi:MAG: porphobilinogen synthase, partial [Aridibacter sp.]
MSNINLPNFPVSRLRRLRQNIGLRDMFRETHLSKNDFIYPLFVAEGENVKNEISSMPDVFQLSVNNILRECEELLTLGVNAVLLFGIPDFKDEVGSSGYAKDGIIQKATREIKKRFPEMLVVTDVCLCEYTSHGHCGVIENERVENDETLELLARQALT